MYWAFSILLIIHCANSAIILWTPKPVLIPALKPFTNEDFAELRKDLDNPTIVAFKTNTLDGAFKLQQVLNNKNMAYLLKTRMDIPNEVEERELTDEILMDMNITGNTLVVLSVEDTFLRIKREPEKGNVTNDEVDESYQPEAEPPITGPVLYTHAVDKTYEVMIYSSKPLMLIIDEVTINLGNTSRIFLDVRGSFTRLIARIITINNRIIFIRFIFSMVSGYWYLNLIEVEVNTIKYNLALVGKNNVTAPSRMSYHCEGETLFTDVKTNISLYVFDLQTQPDARNHRFSDAYNCIPFITAPILSGLFVTSIMCIGLAIGLQALASIKTMDKFDNAKTKQLSVTCFE